MKFVLPVTHRRPLQRGASLIMVMMILIIVSLLGVGGAQIALMSERGARNDRDQQMAWQGAEAALIDAEMDISSTTVTARQQLFNGKAASSFVPGCGNSDISVGLCAVTTAGKPAWLTVDFTSTTQTTAFGTWTGRTFSSGSAGTQPAQAPRYIIELVPEPFGDKANPTFLYRITTMGFGPRTYIQAMVQAIYRI